MIDRSVRSEQAVETVIHSYTEAELALTEIAGAVARFQAASEQLTTAAARNTDAAAALRSATDASDEIGRQLAGVVGALGEAATALRAVDPDRLWAHLERTAARHEEIESGRVRDHAAAMRRDAILSRQTALMLWLGAVAAVGAMIAVVLLVLLAVRVLPM